MNLCRVPWDINPDSSGKSALVSGESRKVDKPPSPQAEKIVPEPSKPPSPKDVQGSPVTRGAPPSPTRATSGHYSAGASSGPEPAESPKASPPGPRSYGLRSTIGHQTGNGSSVPRSEKPPQ
jgi:hypothetical protein